MTGKESVDHSASPVVFFARGLRGLGSTPARCAGTGCGASARIAKVILVDRVIDGASNTFKPEREHAVLEPGESAVGR